MDDELLGEVTTPSSLQRLEPLLLWGDTILTSDNILTPSIKSKKHSRGALSKSLSWTASESPAVAECIRALV